MDKIKLNKDIVVRDGTYQVYISNQFYHFSNRRKAEDFIRAVDNYLSAQFEMINVNLISVYGTYRRLSWYLEAYDRQAIRLQINEIESAIELSLSRSDWSSWKVTTFAKLDYSIQTLDTILGRMQQVAKQKKYVVLSGEIRANLRAVDLLKLEANRFDVRNKKHLREPLTKIIQLKRNA